MYENEYEEEDLSGLPVDKRARAMGTLIAAAANQQRMQMAAAEQARRQEAMDYVGNLMASKTSRTDPEEFRGVGGAKKREMYVQELADQGHTFGNEDINKFYGQEQTTPGMQPNTPEFEQAMLLGLTAQGTDPGMIEKMQKVYGAPNKPNELQVLDQMYPGVPYEEAARRKAAAGRKPEDVAKEEIAVRKGVSDLVKRQLQSQLGGTGVKFEFGEPVFPQGFSQEKYHEDYYNAEKKMLQKYGLEPEYDFYHERGKAYLSKATTEEEQVKKIKELYAVGRTKGDNRKSWTRKQIEKMSEELGWE